MDIIRPLNNLTDFWVLSDEHVRDNPTQEHGYKQCPQGSAALSLLYLADIVFSGFFVNRDIDLIRKCRHIVLILAVGIIADHDGMLLALVFLSVHVLVIINRKQPTE